MLSPEPAGRTPAGSLTAGLLAFPASHRPAVSRR